MVEATRRRGEVSAWAVQLPGVMAHLSWCCSCGEQGLALNTYPAYLDLRVGIGVGGLPRQRRLPPPTSLHSRQDRGLPRCHPAPAVRLVYSAFQVYLTDKVLVCSTERASLPGC